MGNASGSDGGGVGSDRSSGIAGRSGARGAEAGNNQRGGFSGGAMGTPGSDRGGIGGNEANTGRNSAVSRATPSRNVTVTPASRPPAATITVAPPPVRVAPPPVRVAPVPAAPPAPVAAAPTASLPTSPNGMPSLDALAAQRTGQSLASIQGNTAPTAAAPSRSLSPTGRANIADAARAVGARSTGAVSATPSRGTPGGISGGAMAANDRAGISSVSNSSAKGDFGGRVGGVGIGQGISGGRANAGGLGGIGNAANVGLGGSNVAGKSDRGVPGLNSRADIAGLASEQVGRALSSVANKSAPQAAPRGISDLSNAQISGTIGDIVSGKPGNLFGGLSPLGSFATNQPSVASMSRAAAMQGLPSAQGFSAPTMTATNSTPNSMANSRAVQDAVRGLTPSQAQLDRMSEESARAGFSMTPFGDIISEYEGEVTATPTASTQNFYSSDNSFEPASFPSVVDAYPGVFGSATGSLPGGYSTTPQGSWTSTAQSFSNPMDAARAMSPMDQLRAYSMFTSGGTAPPSRGERGGDGRSDAQENVRGIVRRIANALKKQPAKSGWRPYTGTSRFANWTPIQKVLMNG